MRRSEQSFASPSSSSAARKLGGAIRAARLARNLTQADFAERARTSIATLKRIEQGDPAVSFGSWLSALENASLLHLLERLAEPEADPHGSARRAQEARKRASGSRIQDARDETYDF